MNFSGETKADRYYLPRPHWRTIYEEQIRAELEAWVKQGVRWIVLRSGSSLISLFRHNSRDSSLKTRERYFLKVYWGGFSPKHINYYACRG